MKMKIGETSMAPEKMPTIIHLDDTELPEIKNWKIGGRYKIELTVEQMSVGKEIYGDESKNKLSATFKVLKAKNIKKGF